MGKLEEENRRLGIHLSEAREIAQEAVEAERLVTECASDHLLLNYMLF